MSPTPSYAGTNPVNPPTPKPLYGAPIVLDDAYVYSVLNNQIVRVAQP